MEVTSRNLLFKITNIFWGTIILKTMDLNKINKIKDDLQWVIKDLPKSDKNNAPDLEEKTCSGHILPGEYIALYFKKKIPHLDLPDATEHST